MIGASTSASRGLSHQSSLGSSLQLANVTTFHFSDSGILTLAEPAA
jgi:hypothetical protein